MKSEVFFVKVESQNLEARSDALKRILDKVGSYLNYQKDEFLPIKITIGDSACIYHLNPELVKCVVSFAKAKGARPFLFDTNVIYKGQRQNAIDHLNLVQSKGFGHSKVGAPFIVADGVFGKDGKDFEINRQHIKKIKVPSFVGMLDSLLVLSHPTGHIISGYAGAIKNVAMGMVCRSAKQAQHSSLKPSVIEKKCTSCGCCIVICPVDAIAFKKDKAFINQSLCLGCGECICACKFDAIYINWQEEPLIFVKRMCEAADFILSKFKNKFFINFSFDITKECDCISNKDEKMIARNIGILASSDPLAVDKATLDLAQEQKVTAYLEDLRNVYEEMFKYAHKLGMGNLDYDLITV